MDKDSQEIEKDLLIELGRLSAKLPGHVNFTGLSPQDNAIIIAARLKERRENPELQKGSKAVYETNRHDITICPSCQDINVQVQDAYFCERCGTVLKVEVKDVQPSASHSQPALETSLTIFCASCGEVNKFDDKYCSNCGGLLVVSI